MIKPPAREAYVAAFKSLAVPLENIKAPARVLAVEVLGGRWQPAVSSDGVEVEVRPLRRRALVERLPCHTKS
jgi:hypothetical protein